MKNTINYHEKESEKLQNDEKFRAQIFRNTDQQNRFSKVAHKRKGKKK